MSRARRASKGCTREHRDTDSRGLHLESVRRIEAIKVERRSTLSEYTAVNLRGLLKEAYWNEASNLLEIETEMTSSISNEQFKQFEE